MDATTYRQLQSRARRLTATASDAEDLIQDTLLAALQTGRHDLPWLFGVLRKQAAMQARSAVRRKRRDLLAGTSPASDAAYRPDDDAPDDCISRVDLRPLLAGLPPAARRVAVLALHGLSANEIRWLLGLSPAAFRQRLASLRRKLGTPPPSHAEQVALAYLRDPVRSVDLQFGLVRRALKAALHVGSGLGTHDLDGHLLVIRDRRDTADAHVFSRRGN